jgi:hypothetical protein
MPASTPPPSTTWQRAIPAPRRDAVVLGPVHQRPRAARRDHRHPLAGHHPRLRHAQHPTVGHNGQRRHYRSPVGAARRRETIIFHMPSHDVTPDVNPISGWPSFTKRLCRLLRPFRTRVRPSTKPRLPTTQRTRTASDLQSTTDTGRTARQLDGLQEEEQEAQEPRLSLDLSLGCIGDTNREHASSAAAGS